MKFSPKLALKSLALALGTIFITLPATTAAEEAAPGGERRERLQQGADRMAGELGLNDEQKARIKDLAQQEKTELDTLRNSAVQAKEDRHAQAMAVREKYRAQRLAVMTAEQRAKAEKMRDKFEKRRDRMERREERREKTGG